MRLRAARLRRAGGPGDREGTRAGRPLHPGVGRAGGRGGGGGHARGRARLLPEGAPHPPARRHRARAGRGARAGGQAPGRRGPQQDPRRAAAGARRAGRVPGARLARAAHAAHDPGPAGRHAGPPAEPRRDARAAHPDRHPPATGLVRRAAGSLLRRHEALVRAAGAGPAPDRPAGDRAGERRAIARLDRPGRVQPGAGTAGERGRRVGPGPDRQPGHEPGGERHQVRPRRTGRHLDPARRRLGGADRARSRDRHPGGRAGQAVRQVLARRAVPQLRRPGPGPVGGRSDHPGPRRKHSARQPQGPGRVVHRPASAGAGVGRSRSAAPSGQSTATTSASGSRKRARAPTSPDSASRRANAPAGNTAGGPSTPA